MGMRYSTSPTFRLKPKNALLKAPVLYTATKSDAKKTVRVVGSRVTGATKYQAMCTNGAGAKFATSKTPSVLVTDLAPGKWKCQVRGVSKIGGRWSSRANVSIK